MISRRASFCARFSASVRSSARRCQTSWRPEGAQDITWFDNEGRRRILVPGAEGRRAVRRARSCLAAKLDLDLEFLGPDSRQSAFGVLDLRLACLDGLAVSISLREMASASSRMRLISLAISACRVSDVPDTAPFQVSRSRAF